MGIGCSKSAMFCNFGDAHLAIFSIQLLPSSFWCVFFFASPGLRLLGYEMWQQFGAKRKDVHVEFWISAVDQVDHS
jgi:hypothetical protein